ncbi:hypothetical protein BOTBODRAFT_492965 [Botryobasidium botryosum FD-172 SS1]|uniref:Uncharacterized protein n=1 Tax=Botryobasidium botryosum (strain FD-172 SS1) TaxID=930990 RepID=A0A067MF50_BOTB1|nr:hypothetical protein BOTBODRAFT_492965 [Botryobasidium botryosum FD-172 SS1]
MQLRLNMQTWTFYPDASTLSHCIQIEEASLRNRANELAAGRPDPGRPSFDATYGNFPEYNTWTVYFGLHFDLPQLARYGEPSQIYYTYAPPGHPARGVSPPFPPISLIASVNIGVMMLTRSMAAIYPWLTEAGRAQLSMGFYLLALWFADPNNIHATFAKRNKILPSPNDSLPLWHNPPAAPAIPPYLHSDDSTTLLAHSPDAGPSSSEHRDGLPGDIAAAAASSNPQASPPQTRSQFPACQESAQSEGKAVPEPGGGNYHTYTSNEWAMIVYGKNLGGPLWDI